MVGDATFLLVRAWHGVEARLTCRLKGSGTDGGISDVGPWRDGSTDHRAIAIDDDAHTHVALDSTLYAWGDESTAVADDLTSRECIAGGASVGIPLIARARGSRTLTTCLPSLLTESTRYGVAYLLALGTTGGGESFSGSLCSLSLGLSLTLGLSASGSLYLQTLLMLLGL